MPGPIAWRIPVMVILVIGVWWFFLALRLANWQQDWRFRVSKKEACTGSIALKVSFSLLIYIYHHSFLFKKRIDWSLIFHLGKSHNWLRGFDDRKSARTVFRRDICFLSFFLSFFLLMLWKRKMTSNQARLFTDLLNWLSDFCSTRGWGVLTLCFQTWLEPDMLKLIYL